MTKDIGKNFLIVLSCLFIILFAFLFVKKDRKSEVDQNILSSDLSGNVDINKKIGLWHGEEVQIPPYIFDTTQRKVLSVVPKEERWVEVNLSDQKLTAWEDGKVFWKVWFQPDFRGFPPRRVNLIYG